MIHVVNHHGVLPLFNGEMLGFAKEARRVVGPEVNSPTVAMVAPAVSDISTTLSIRGGFAHKIVVATIGHRKLCVFGMRIDTPYCRTTAKQREISLWPTRL